MAIDSHFYDTVPGQGINEIEWAQSALSRGPLYGVASASELLCTPHPATPYAVNISPAPSGFWGHGVWDTSDAIETVVCTPPAQGARRFDLIAARRDWTPTGGGPTNITKVQGSALRSLPSMRESRPGEVDDQPVWLVEWVGGQTQPQSLTDLRCFAGNGGMMANDRLALEYLKVPGASVRIGSTTWEYQEIENRQWDWVGSYTEYKPVADTGYETRGEIGVELVGGGRRRVTVNIQIERRGDSFPLTTSYSGLGPVIPAQARGAGTGIYLPVALSGGGGNNALDMVFVDPVSGVISIRAISQHTWLKGALFSVNCAYYI